MTAGVHKLRLRYFHIYLAVQKMSEDKGNNMLWQVILNATYKQHTQQTAANKQSVCVQLASQCVAG